MKANQLPQADGNLRALQLRMLAILKEIDKICRKNNIRYWIAFGTLLGAVRHKGFIPWDDDMDILVHEDDYERFQQVCSEQLPSWLSLQNDQTDPEAKMGVGLCKIRDNNSILLQSFDDLRRVYNKGAFVDVFKAVISPKRSDKVFTFLLKRITFSYGFFRFYPQLNLHNIVCYLLYPLSYVWHKSLLWLLTRGGKPYYCTQMGEAIFIQKHMSKLDDIFPLKEIEFEGCMFMGPSNPNAYLRTMYGNYMKIPVPEKRRIHALYFVQDVDSVKLNYEEPLN